jgi:hypothetical protein
MIDPDLVEMTADDIPVTYLSPVHATTVHLAVNNADFVVAFALIKPAFGSRGLQPGYEMQSVGCISLSPATAKQMYRALGRAISTFEEGTGVAIPYEEGSVQEIDASLADRA